MAGAKKSFVSVLPDGAEAVHEVYWDSDPHWNRSKYRDMAEEAVQKAGMRTHRNDPKTVKVAVHCLEIQAGKLVRMPPARFDVQVPVLPLTEDEYTQELADALNELPEAFRTFVVTKAWADGHSAGYEEVLSHARELVEGLKPCIAEFKKK